MMVRLAMSTRARGMVGVTGGKTIITALPPTTNPTLACQESSWLRLSKHSLRNLYLECLNLPVVAKMFLGSFDCQICAIFKFVLVMHYE